MVELALGRRGQLVAVDVELHALERLRRIAIGDALEPRHHAALGRHARALDPEAIAHRSHRAAARRRRCPRAPPCRRGSPPRRGCHARPRCGREECARALASRSRHLTPQAWPRRPRPSSAASAAAASRSRRFFFGLALFGLLLGLALGEARRVEEARHAVGRLRADAEPVLDALDVELDAVGVVLGQQRVVRADLLDVAPVARRGRPRPRRCRSRAASWCPRARGGSSRTWSVSLLVIKSCSLSGPGWR